MTDRTGSALYAGGRFTRAGGITANNIARWDGTQWTRLSGGVNDTVYAFRVLASGAARVLYVGGAFTTADGLPANRIAAWADRRAIEPP